MSQALLSLDPRVVDAAADLLREVNATNFRSSFLVFVYFHLTEEIAFACLDNQEEPCMRETLPDWGFLLFSSLPWKVYCAMT